MNTQQPGKRLLAGALAALVVSPLPLQGAPRSLKGEIDALYRPVDGRLLVLQTMLPPRRDAEGNAQPRPRACPEKVIIGGLEKDQSDRRLNFSPEIYVDGPIVIDCRR